MSTTTPERAPSRAGRNLPAAHDNAKQGALEGTYWGIGSVASHFAADAPGYGDKLVHDIVSEVRTDLDCFSDAESAVLQNHGYLLADAGIRYHATRFAAAAPPAVAPFPEWLDEERVRAALADSAKRKMLGRWRWRHWWWSCTSSTTRCRRCCCCRRRSPFW